MSNCWHHNDTAKQRIAESKRRHWEDPIYREKMLAVLADARARNIGRPSPLTGRTKEKHTAEARAKMSVSIRAAWARQKALGSPPRKRNPHSAETRAKLSAAHVGMKHTIESRLKMSASRKGRKRNLSPEGRAAISAKFRGRPSPFPNRRFYYNGVPFRSSWEVMAAIAMDALGIRWEYESKRFDLVSQTYAPDFYLPDDGAYWEVKGYFGPKSQRTISLFRAQYPEIPLVLLTERGLRQLEHAASLRAKAA